MTSSLRLRRFAPSLEAVPGPPALALAIDPRFVVVGDRSRRAVTTNRVARQTTGWLESSDGPPNTAACVSTRTTPVYQETCEDRAQGRDLMSPSLRPEQAERERAGSQRAAEAA